MPKSIISEGKTSIEAIEKGLKELNVSKNQVEIRIIEEKKKSFFNILEPHVVKVEITLKEDALDGYNICPVCLIYQDTPYCAVCGQRLNWEVEE